MSYAATILIAPCLTLEHFNDPTWARPGRTLYERGSLKLWPNEEHPVLVNHDQAKRVGTVTGLDVIEWTDGPWIYARAIVDDAPSWLRYGTRASFGYGVVHEREYRVRDARAEVLASGYVSEVSVLSPDRKPEEPKAQV